MYDLMFVYIFYFKIRIIYKNVLIFIFLFRKIMESRVFCKYVYLYFLCLVFIRFYEIFCSGLRGVVLIKFWD